MGIYQPTEEDIQIDQELQKIRERNVELNKQMMEDAKDYLLSKPDYFEPYDSNVSVSARRSLDPRINTLLYGHEVDRTNGILKDYQGENLYAMEAIKQTGEYTTIVLGRVSINGKWKVVLEGSYYELRSAAL